MKRHSLHLETPTEDDRLYVLTVTSGDFEGVTNYTRAFLPPGRPKNFKVVKISADGEVYAVGQRSPQSLKFIETHPRKGVTVAPATQEQIDDFNNLDIHF